MTFKKINPEEKIFYVFELNTITFSIFDSSLDQAIYHGNWNIASGIIRSIKENMKDASIYYYVINRGELKLDKQWSYRLGKNT